MSSAANPKNKIQRLLNIYFTLSLKGLLIKVWYSVVYREVNALKLELISAFLIIYDWYYERKYPINTNRSRILSSMKEFEGNKDVIELSKP